MSNMATKKATNELEKVLKVLGPYGGTIKTDAPSTWWNLEATIDPEYDDNQMEVFIGLYSQLNGDIVSDPSFSLILTMEDNNIASIEIMECDEFSPIYRDCYIDSQNIWHSYSGLAQKDPLGLKKRFSEFMNTIVNLGPYLNESAVITKFMEV